MNEKMSNKYIIDFDNLERGYRGYPSGSLRTQSVKYGDDYYLLKFPEKNRNKTHEYQASSYLNNSISEHIGCRIFASVSVKAQETLLGKIDGDIVVACKDFVDREHGFELQEFSTIAKEFYSTSETGRYPSVEKVSRIIHAHPLLSSISADAMRHYWDMQIIDALIGNFDRHTANWGYIINHNNNTATVAPIYDCGSSLWPKIDDKYLGTVLASEDQINELTYKLPRGRIQFTEQSTRMGFADALMNIPDKYLAEELLRIVPEISMDKVTDIISDTPYISEERAMFLREIIASRLEKVILPAYEVRAAYSHHEMEYSPMERSAAECDIELRPNLDKIDAE
jgi:hypothetical protein